MYLRHPCLFYCNSPLNSCVLRHLQSISFVLQLTLQYMYSGTSAIHIFCIAIHLAIHVFWDICNPCILGHLQSISFVLQFTLQYMFSGTSAIHVLWDICNPYLLYCNSPCNTCILGHPQSMYFGTSAIHIFGIAIYFAIHVLWDIRNPYLLFCNLLCNTCILRHPQSISFELQFTLQYMNSEISAIHSFCIAICLQIHVFWDIPNLYDLHCKLLCNTCILRHQQSIYFILQFTLQYMYIIKSAIHIFCIAIYLAIHVF